MLTSRGIVDEIAIEMITNDNINFRNTYNMIEIDKIPNYITTLGLNIDRDLYHPNEIFAHYFSEMVLNIKPKDNNIMDLVDKLEKK